jgi:hypothetical protein
MRITLVAVSLAFCATPVFAQAESPMVQLPPELADPATADRLADSMQSMSNALLDMKIGGIQAALEGREPTRAERNLTVRDLGRRKNPNFDRDLQRQIAAAKPKMEQGIRAFNQAIPEIARGLAEAQKSVERALSNMPDPNYPRR